MKTPVIWMTGLSGSGKTTISKQLINHPMIVNPFGKMVNLDGDELRKGICSDLGFDDKDRCENIRRVSNIAKIFQDNQIPVIVSTISPFYLDRQRARNLIGEGYIEIFLDIPIDKCIERDVKGLYEKANNGEIENFTGFTSNYEAPSDSEIVLTIEDQLADICCLKIIHYLIENKYIRL